MIPYVLVPPRTVARPPNKRQRLDIEDRRSSSLGWSIVVPPPPWRGSQSQKRGLSSIPPRHSYEEDATESADEDDRPRTSRRSASFASQSNSDSPSPEATSTHYKHPLSSQVVAQDGSYDAQFYEVHPDELVEDADLQVIGETEPDDGDSDLSSEEASDIPVRLLSDFTVYRTDTQELVSIAELFLLGHRPGIYGASGAVKPWTNDEEDEEDEGDADNELDAPLELIKLSPIMEFNVHHVVEVTKELDSKIYLRTKFSWYILSTPSQQYRPFFMDFWVKHRITHLVISSAMTDPRLSYNTFIDSLRAPSKSLNSVEAISMLGRELTEEDISDDITSYIIGVLVDLQDKERIKLGRVPLIRRLTGDDERLEDKFSIPRLMWRANSPKAQKAPKASLHAVDANIEKEVLKHRNETVVTPVIGSIAAGLFQRTLQLARHTSEEPDNDDGSLDTLDEGKLHAFDPMSIRWQDRSGPPGYYRSVKLDGVPYQIGDMVIVEPGEDEDDKRAANARKCDSKSKNSLADKWFAKICYMYEKGLKHYMHVQWYVHGSKTLLQEIAHPKGLFSMSLCDDVPLASILRKCNLRQLTPDEQEPEDDNGVENDFFYNGLTWDETDTAFVEISPRDAAESLVQCKFYQKCLSCGLSKAEKTKSTLTTHGDEGFSQYGVTYHAGDFIYVLRESDHDAPYIIAQIVDLEAGAGHRGLCIRICLLARYDDIVRREGRAQPGLSNQAEKDERRLFMTSKTDTVHASRVAGKCYVVHPSSVRSLDSWVCEPDHFYIRDTAKSPSIKSLRHLTSLDPGDVQTCGKCHAARVEFVTRRKTLLRQNRPMRGLELFAGAGGLSTGFDLSGFVDTKWAIEFSPSCCLSYANNKPGTTVLNQCTNLLLQHAIDTYQGKGPSALKSNLDGKTNVAPMPQPGDVDFIYGGLPCQSFSGANHYKRADDVRSTLVCNMLSYVEFYRPAYFLLENVVGLVHFPLKGRQDGRRLVGGIKQGVVKFIMRSLVCLGYQVRFKILQAGHYGAPQGRRRVIFWGARLGVPLPLFPIPTHCFERQHNATLSNGKLLYAVTRAPDSDDVIGAAPLYAVTIGDAISDLPAFEWKNPHVVCRRTRADADEEAERKADGIPVIEATKASHGRFPGYPQRTPYATRPLTRYQRWVRSQNNTTIGEHYTGRFSHAVVERTVNIPLRPEADYRDLPPALALGKKAAQIEGNKPIAGLYARTDMDGFFRTAMTSVRPNAHGSSVLHPTQKRVLTVRECARAQGFPDHWEFLSVNKRPGDALADQLRQIGNAVPIPLARALGGALGDALIGMWERNADEAVDDEDDKEELRSGSVECMSKH